MKKKLCNTPAQALAILGPYDNDIDYVGPKGAEIFIPRYIVGVDINHHAYEHDLEYIMGGDAEDKLQSDLQFLAKMMYSIETAKFWYGFNWIMKSIGRRLVMHYYQAVVVAGDSSFCFVDGEE